MCGRETELGERLHDVDRHEHGDAEAGERRDRPEERLAKVVAVRGRERELELGERIDRDPSRLLALDGLAHGGERLVDRQVERAEGTGPRRARAR